MNCAEAKYWLLSSESINALPEAVLRHVAECTPCERLHANLIVLNDMTLALPFPDSRPSQQCLLEKLPAGLSPVPARTWTPSSRIALAWLRTLAAAVFGFGLAWMLARNPEPEPKQEKADLAALPDLPRQDELMLARFMERNQALVKAATPAEQFEVLLQMSNDLCREATDDAHSTASPDVSLYSGLYQRVLAQGIVSRMLAMPPEERAIRLGKLVEQIRRDEVEIDRMRAHHPELADSLKPISFISRAAEQKIKAGIPLDDADMSEMAPLPDGLTTSNMLLTALVLQGIRLANEDDPERRADYNRELRDVEGLIRRADGVIRSLERDGFPKLTHPTDPTAVASQKERIRELEKVLKDLEKAVKQIKHDFDKAEHGKGPPPKDKEKGKMKGKEKEKEREERGKPRDKGGSLGD